MSTIGYPLGILIGVITGFVFTTFLRTARHDVKAQFSTGMKISTQLLAMPTFWFGGPWVTTQFLRTVNIDEVLPGYLLALTLMFLLVIGWPLVKYVIEAGKEVGEYQRRSQ
jgi:hypothetical protein